MLRGNWQAEVNAKAALEAQERAREESTVKAEEDAKRRGKQARCLMSVRTGESPGQQRAGRRGQKLCEVLMQRTAERIAETFCGALTISPFLPTL